MQGFKDEIECSVEYIKYIFENFENSELISKV
jgi:hypothetical protein